MTETDSAPGWRALVGGGNAGAATVIGGGIALHAVSIYVVATIMPVVVGEIGGLAFFAWTATLYVGGSLAAAAGVPALVARRGAREAYRLGFILFMLGSLVCSLAPSMPVLLVGRLLQGFGGGMLPALGYASIRRLFPPALHARAIAALGSVWGVAALAGPMFGGIFASPLFAALGGWRAAFWVDLLIGTAFLVVAERVLPAGRGEVVARPFAGLRLALLVGGAMAVSAGGVSGRPVEALAGLTAAVVLILAALRLDARSAARLLPGGAYNPGTALGAVSGTMALSILAMSPCNFVPYMLRAGHGLAPIEGGYAAALIALAWTGVSLVTAGWTGRGMRAAIVAGPAAMLAGLLLDGWGLSGGGPAGAAVAIVVVGQLVVGTGIGMSWAHLAALLMASAPQAERDTAGPFITTTQTLAAVFGSALAGMTANLGGIAGAASPGEVNAVAWPLFGGLAILPLLGCLTAWQALRLTRG